VLKASLHPLPFRATCGGGCGTICYRQHFLFFLLPLKFALAIQNFRVVLFIEILTLIFILLIFNFCSWPFCKISIYFQFHLWIQIYDMLIFFNLVLIILIVFFLSFSSIHFTFQFHPLIKNYLLSSNLFII
jgi:hypothetical protein